MRHCWFFFSLIFKSMVLQLKATAAPGQSKKTQFSKTMYQNLQKLMYKHAEFINKALVRRMNIELANFVNLQIGFFLRDLLSVGHRGYLFAVIETYADVFALGNTSLFEPNMCFGLSDREGLDDFNATEAKLRFLKVICDHEHFLALNFPAITALNPRLIARIHETFAYNFTN
jgi:hypothetical protein